MEKLNDGLTITIRFKDGEIHYAYQTELTLMELYGTDYKIVEHELTKTWKHLEGALKEKGIL